MKKISLIACAVASAMCAQAWAADFEIYGRADFNFGVDNYHGGTKNGETNWGLNDGGSRFGFNLMKMFRSTATLKMVS